jgi:hypothetical protein
VAAAGALFKPACHLADVPRRVPSTLSGMTSSTARHTVTHASGVMTLVAPALPRHGASGETVTVAPGIAALYAVPMSSRVTGWLLA